MLSFKVAQLYLKLFCCMSGKIWAKWWDCELSNSEKELSHLGHSSQGNDTYGSFQILLGVYFSLFKLGIKEATHIFLPLSIFQIWPLSHAA